MILSQVMFAAAANPLAFQIDPEIDAMIDLK